MKSTFILFFLILSFNSFSQKTDSSNYFVKKLAKPVNDESDSSYFLRPKFNAKWSFFIEEDRFISNLKNFKDSLLLLESLLAFEGDIALVSLRAGTYSSSNPERPSYIVPLDTNYNTTVEVMALFIFNTIIEHKPFFIATFPRLQAKKIGSPGYHLMFIQNDKRLENIFKFYNVWLKKCETMGRFNQIEYPLENSGFSWL